MTAFGVSSMFFHEYTIDEIFSFVAQAGLDALEFWSETPHFWLRDQPVGEVRAARAAHPRVKTLTLHTPVLDLNPCSINPGVAEVSVGYAVRSIAQATGMGASILTVHPGRRTAKRPPGPADFARFETYISALREAVLKDTVVVSLENMEPKVNSLVCTPDLMREVLDSEPWLKFTLDTSHALAASEQTVEEYIRLCGDRLANVHISRVHNGVLHLPLDRNPAIEKILGMLADIRYAGPLTLEIDDLTFPRAISSEEKIAVLARDNAFMRECMAR
ncbi:MAG: sugar phosphate isomerase/epimerase family protein [Methanoregula sp.]|jgi:sugar phosphate isomerase/epimerase